MEEVGYDAFSQYSHAKLSVDCVTVLDHMTCFIESTSVYEVERYQDLTIRNRISRFLLFPYTNTVSFLSRDGRYKNATWDLEQQILSLTQNKILYFHKSFGRQGKISCYPYPSHD